MSTTAFLKNFLLLKVTKLSNPTPAGESKIAGLFQGHEITEGDKSSAPRPKALATAAAVLRGLTRAAGLTPEQVREMTQRLVE